MGQPQLTSAPIIPLYAYNDLEESAESIEVAVLKRGETQTHALDFACRAARVANDFGVRHKG